MTCVNGVNINITRDGAEPIQLSWMHVAVLAVLETETGGGGGENEEDTLVAKQPTDAFSHLQMKCICHSEANRLKGSSAAPSVSPASGSSCQLDLPRSHNRDSILAAPISQTSGRQAG